METFLTKAMTIVALICFLMVGAAATAIIGRDSIPAPRLELASASVSAVQGPVSNREIKQDRLAVVSYALEPSEPRQIDPALNESLRRAYASTSPADIGMPKEDGYALMRSVRAMTSEDVAQVPAIALTAHVRPEDAERALASGFQMHLAKPVDSSRLLSAVTSTLVSSWISGTMSFADDSPA